VSAPAPNYAHKATFLRGHDGDSFWLSVDFGMNVAGVQLVLPCYVRLANIDCWELSQPLGLEAKTYTEVHLYRGPVVVQTIKPSGSQVGKDEYGRWLARVFVGDDELSDLLRAAGYEKARS
jgi:endonuclease YncB( thermonuclease family)